MKQNNNRKIGTKYEEKAAEYLKSKGYDIIERNFTCRQGEIDIIAKEGETLVFVEVKYRNSTRYGTPSEAVDTKKQYRIMTAAQYYIVKNRISDDTQCRYDVIAILGNKIELIKNAFGGLV